MTEAGRLRLAIDLDGVLTEHPRPLAHAASARFGVEMPESAFVDSAGLNVPDQVRDWVYSPDGPAAKLQPDPAAADFLRRAIDLVGAENIAIVTARPEPSAEMTRAWLRAARFPRVPDRLRRPESGRRPALRLQPCRRRQPAPRPQLCRRRRDAAFWSRPGSPATSSTIRGSPPPTISMPSSTSSPPTSPAEGRMP